MQLIQQLLIFQHFLAILHYVFLDNTLNLYLLIQHKSSDFVPQSYLTSGLDTASLLSSDVQTALLSGNLFSEVLVPTPVAPHVRIPEYYTYDQSRPPTPNFADYHILVDGITIYDPQNDPILAERFITTSNSLSTKRKETELKRLQTPNLELKFEVNVKLQCLNPHSKFHIAKIEHKTTPGPFEVILVNFNRDPELHDLAYGKIVFYNPFSGLKYTTSF